LTCASKEDQPRQIRMSATVLVVDDSPTIRRVVSRQLTARGYEVLVASDGTQAVQVLLQRPVDVVLLDFVMPGMNGLQLCRAMRAMPNMSSLPIVMMSAKVDKIRGPSMQQAGAVDAISKPFDPLALHAVIENALTKSQRSESESPTVEEDAAEMSRINNAPDVQTRDQAVASLFAKQLARVLGAQVVPARDSEERSELHDVISSALPLEKVRSLRGLLSLLNDENERAAVLAGDLGFISIAEVMQMLELQRQTGALRITYGNQEICFYFCDGRIDLAKGVNLSNSFLLGRFLVEDGVVDRRRLDGLLGESGATQRLLGETMVERKLALESQISEALKRQTSELAYEAVRWKNGRFTFAIGQSVAEAALARLALAPGGLLMEGFRRVDEWQLIEGSFQFDDVLSPDRTAIERLGERAELTAQEELVLAAVNGERSVRKIVDDVDASTFDVCKSLYQFINSGLVRRASNG
jgi:CheY-like chemotaxis protein